MTPAAPPAAGARRARARRRRAGAGALLIDENVMFVSKNSGPKLLAHSAPRVPHLDVRRPPVAVAPADLAVRAAVGAALVAAAGRHPGRAAGIADGEVAPARPTT